MIADARGAERLLNTTTGYWLLRFAYLAQVAEAVDARLVAVAPAEGERVAPDYLHILDGQLVGHRLGAQHALARELVDALRARAQPSQLRRLVNARATVGPGDAQARVR